MNQLRALRTAGVRLAVPPQFGDRYTPAHFSEGLTEVSIKEGGRVEVTEFPTLGSPWQGPTWLG
ncbi:MAG: hypothetical protein WCD04_19025 [Terriglobia bacterium]|jgi:hypothetical protein